MNYIDLIPYFAFGLSVLASLYKSYKLSDPATFLYNNIMKLIPNKYEKIVHQARVAALAMKFIRYIKTDLADGKFDDYDIFDLFLTVIETKKSNLKAYLQSQK